MNRVYKPSSLITALLSDGSLLYVAPDTGRDGMVDLTEALARAGIECIERTPAPERSVLRVCSGLIIVVILSLSSAAA